MIDPAISWHASATLRLDATHGDDIANTLKQTWPPRPATFDLTRRHAVLWTSPVSSNIASIRPGSSPRITSRRKMRTGEKLGVGPEPRPGTAYVGS